MDTITIISSYKLGVSELKSAESLAAKKLGVTGKVQNIVDKSVIAGIKIVSGGRELDLSTSGSLARIAQSLT